MGAGATATTTAIVISGGILLVAWYFASNEKAPAWQFVGVGAVSVAVLLGGGLAAQIMDDPEHEEEHVENGEPTPPPSGGLLLTLDDNVFVFDGAENPTITVGANVPVTIQLDNVGTALHNVHVAAPEYGGTFCETGGDVPCSDPERIDGGEQGVLEFNLPPGTYDYRCDFHVAEMTGTIEVVEGGPTGGEAPPPPDGEPGGPDGEPGGTVVEMDDNVFIVDGEENPDIEVPANTPVTLELENTGSALHNMHIASTGDFESAFCDAGGDIPCSEPERVPGGDSATITFNLPPGEYTYRCDFHVAEMEGTLVVGP
jgi:plastocyanin